MNTGLSMLFCLGEPFQLALKRINEFDVDWIEIVDEGLHTLNTKRVDVLKKIARDKGLEFTMHAPFVDINIASPNPVLRRVMLKRLERSLGYARKLNCRQWVFHPGWESSVKEFYPNLDWQTNLRSVRTLQNTSKKLGVDVAIENAPEPMHFLIKSMQDLALFYSELGDDIGLTLDVAHANTAGQTLEFIEKFSDKLVHVHVSDNEGKYDSHRGIGRGNIKWEDVADSLKRVGYKGIVMLESVENISQSLEALRRLFG